MRLQPTPPLAHNEYVMAILGTEGADSRLGTEGSVRRIRVAVKDVLHDH